MTLFSEVTKERASNKTKIQTDGTLQTNKKKPRINVFSKLAKDILGF